jgi:hypothetical protein
MRIRIRIKQLKLMRIRIWIRNPVSVTTILVVACFPAVAGVWSIAGVHPVAGILLLLASLLLLVALIFFWGGGVPANVAVGIAVLVSKTLFDIWQRQFLSHLMC